MIFWNWSISLAMGTAVWLYLRGWRQLNQANAPTLPPRLWRLHTFLAAIFLLTGVLFTPLHRLAVHYFSLHALQRLLLITVVPVLLLKGDPAPILQAGMPVRLQTRLAELPLAAPRFYAFLVRMTSPLPAWFLFACNYWLWHDVQVDRLVLQVGWLHRLENVALLGTAVLYWWHILAASPRLHTPVPALWRVGYAALGAAPVKLVGLVLLFNSHSVYQYTAEISIGNLDVTDQSLGAGIVWVLGGIVFTWTAVFLMRDWLKVEDDKPHLPESLWSSEKMLAPGFGKSKA